MAQINLIRAIKVNLGAGRWADLPAGEQDVTDELADHWYVKAHMVGAPKPQYPVGSIQYISRRRVETEEEAAAQTALAVRAAAERQRHIERAAEMARERSQQAIAQDAKTALDVARSGPPSPRPPPRRPIQPSTAPPRGE